MEVAARGTLALVLARPLKRGRVSGAPGGRAVGKRRAPREDEHADHHRNESEGLAGHMQSSGRDVLVKQRLADEDRHSSWGTVIAGSDHLRSPA